MSEGAEDRMERLIDKGVFDLRTFRSWRDAAKEANRRNEVIHMGRVFGIMVEKNSESAKTER